MALVRLFIERFTAFESARFEFAPGVNALIGLNGTGKSHLLKLLYVLHEALRQYWSATNENEEIDRLLGRLLKQTFRPDEIGRLVRRTAKGKQTARVEALWRDEAGKEFAFHFSLTHKGTLQAVCEVDPELNRPAVFLPTREVISFFKGFTALWDEYDLEFDRTYRDVCHLLALPPLRGPRTADRRKLLDPLERALGGTASIENGRFYVKLPDGDMEAHLVAEGLRKLAMLAYLVVNGSLSRRSMLLWDEPEASVNPALAQLLARTAFALAAQGVQVVLASHDYVLVSELSLLAEEALTPEPEEIGNAFFGLQHGGDGRREVERADRFTGLQTNPILDALAALHDREMSAGTAEAP